MRILRHLLPAMVSAILVAAIITAAQPANTIALNGKNYYINGINVPWNANRIGRRHALRMGRFI